MTDDNCDDHRQINFLEKQMFWEIYGKLKKSFKVEKKIC